MLYKNVWKLFKKKKFQLLGVGLIIFASSFLFVSMFNSMVSLDEIIDKYYDDCNQEDFSVTMNEYLTEEEYIDNYSIMKLSDLKKLDKNYYSKVINNRIDNFKSNYNKTEIELRESKDISLECNNEPIRCRALKDSENINLSLIEDGRKPKNNDEIAIPKVFAESNSLKMGDSLTVNNKEYKIVGYFMVPDYTLLMFGNELIVGNDKVTIALFTDEEFDNINGNEHFNLAGKYTNKVKDNYFDNCNLSYVVNIVDTEENMVSGYFSLELDMGTYMSISLSLFVVLIAVVIVAIILYKIIQMEKNQIGVLKSLGYLDKEIIRPYLMLINLLALPMLILGSIVGEFCSQPLIDLFRQMYLFPESDFKGNYLVCILAVILPLIVFIAFSYIIVRLFLRKKPLDLLKVGDNTKISKLTKLVDRILSRTKTTTKFKYSFILRNKGKFFVFLLGYVFAAFLVIISLVMPDAFNKMSTEAYDLVDYKYEAYIDITKELPKLNSNEEKNISIKTKYKDDLITLKGLETNNKLYNIYSEDNDNITKKLEKGIVISNSFATLYDKEKGDKISLLINGEEIQFKVLDVSRDYGNATVYFDIEDLSELYCGEGNKGYFTGIYSDKEIDEEDYSYVICKDDIKSQVSSLNELVFVAIGLIMGVAIILTVIILFVLTSLTVEDNFYNISLLKVMGYKKKEVNSMILNSYLVYGIIVYIITVPFAVISMKLFLGTIISDFGMVMPFDFKIWQGVAGLIFIIICYYLGTLSSKRKINELSLQEVLKEYRE